jgi:flagellin
VIAGTSIADHTAASTNTTNSNFNDNAVAAYTAQSPSSVSSSYYSTGVSVGIGAVYSSGSKVADSSATIVDQNTVVGTGSNNATLTYGGTTNTGIVSDASGAGGVATISYTDAAGQSLVKTDLSNQTDAQAALTSLNAAISDVSAQDGYIGAQINTLNSASSVLSTQSENVQSAQNAVQATDYASATSNMSKYEILSQTGISALAQANSMQQEVTKLLQ